MPDPIKPRPVRGASQRVRTGSRTTVACLSCKDRKLRECYDPATKRHYPRNYLETLEQRVATLEGIIRGMRAAPVSNDRTAVQDIELSDLSSMIGTLSLNAAGAEPHYLGSSSAFAFARFVEPVIRQAITLMPPRIAVQFSDAYFGNIHTQYPFLHEPTFRQWETRLYNSIHAVLPTDSVRVPFYFLNMVYAVGALLLPKSGCSPEQLYASALLYIDDVLCYDNLECIQAILCSATYSLRSSKGTSHWKLAGQALRQCVNLGYHRNHRRLGLNVSPAQAEMQKRTFWSAYTMECAAAVMLGRPLSLNYNEIDAELPLDVEYDVDESLNPRATNLLTYANPGFSIRALQGRIQTALYADLTSPSGNEARRKKIENLREALRTWNASIPSAPITPPAIGALSFFTTPDWYQCSYNYTLLQLYRLQITDVKALAPLDIILECIHAAESSCRCFRRQFIGKPTTYTWSALHELFIAGLTYLYCLWISPAVRELMRPDRVSSACTDCIMVLVAIAEQWKDAAPYRDVFEALSNHTMTIMTNWQEANALQTATGTASVQTPARHDTILPECLLEWMTGISQGSGISTGVDRLLNGFFDDFVFPDLPDVGLEET
ncbi:fungal-specific transcription factor domain-containing protein [Aspergillus spinulosporus]